MSSSSEEEWDKDTDEINSLDSEELHETRPNRWQGAPQTWRVLTEQDRTIHDSLQNVQNQDLSVHLYNAFALKQKRRRFDVGPDPEKDVDKETGEPVAGPSSWKFPRRWTAWPMRANEVPPADLLQRTLDEEEVFTTRHLELTRPGQNVEEDVSATILRLARNRFRKRMAVDSDEDGDTTAGEDEDVQDTPGAESAMSEGATTDSSDEDQGTEGPNRHYSLGAGKSVRNSRRPAPKSDFEPAIATDDELSYHVLRPSVRRIRKQLDDTLRVLHNARVAAMMVPGDDSGSESASVSVVSRSRSARSLGRMTPAPESQPGETGESQEGGGKRKRGGGRPKKHINAREGETAEETTMRIARERKQRLPLSQTDKSDKEGHRQNPNKQNREQGRGRVRNSRSRSRLSGSDSERSVSTAATGSSRRSYRRFTLRDWRDVVGAAALAGFSPKVVARTAQRCATLFEQSMEITRIEEVHLGRAATAPEKPVQKDTTTRYDPGDVNSPPHDSSDEDVDEEIRHNLDKYLEQRRSVSRVRSSSRRPTSSRERGPSSRRSSRSRSSTAGIQHFCPHPLCPRAIEGFPRKANMKRHLETVHKNSHIPLEVDEVDTEDELDGAVHVDGFLRPIKMRKGWRGANRSPRKASTWGGSGRRRGGSELMESERDAPHSEPMDISSD